MNFFDGETPGLLEQLEIMDTTILDDDDEVVAMIKELIESRMIFGRLILKKKLALSLWN